MQFSQYLKDKNITQEQAAKELDVAQGMISLWATGERLPRPENMAKIVKWSGGEVQPNDFYEVK
jgi:transcriptional regulator with XRE-family HTH domain